jgi:hypothetical protein
MKFSFTNSDYQILCRGLYNADDPLPEGTETQQLSARGEVSMGAETGVVWPPFNYQQKMCRSIAQGTRLTRVVLAI